MSSQNVTNNNALNGSNFEHKVERLLRKLNVSYLSQYTVEGNEARLDILIKTASGRMTNLSCKKSNRERYTGTGIETLHLREAYPNAVSYIITEDNDHTIELVKNSISRSKTVLKPLIKDVVSFDNLPTLIKKLKPQKFNRKPRKIKNFVDYRSNL